MHHTLMAGKIVCIRVNKDDWDAFKEVAEQIGISRNALINMFIRSIITGKSHIEQRANIMNVNINLVPISNTINDVSILVNQTKAMKNELILDEIRDTISKAMNSVENPYNRNRGIPICYKEKLKKLIDKASYIPPELFEQARKIILT